MPCVLQDWVLTLGLRHQGVLLTAVRGPDTSPKEDHSKALVRCYRADVLNAHAGDAKKSKSFIEWVDATELVRRMEAVIKDHDALPHHWLMHFIHAAEIVGYCHPISGTSTPWYNFYRRMAGKFHMTPETKAELDARLGADEETFVRAQ